MMAMRHNKVDEVSDVMREVYEAVENNLKYIPLKGLVKNTPLAEIDRELRDTSNRSKKLLNELSGKLNVDIKDTNNKMVDRLSASVRLRSADKLRSDLERATLTGIENEPKVRTPSGRKWGYKEYMEMSIRTSLSRELGDMQLETGGRAGIVFYVTNIFQDCADDHKDYQGKYYYDMRYKEFGYDAETVKEIEKIIRDKKVMPLQYVRENKPYMGTRPNCRHTFTPVALMQAKNIKPERLASKTGTYKDDNYKATQTLRANERAIRNYNNKRLMSLKLSNDAKNSGNLELAQALRNRARHYLNLERKWQNSKVALIKKYPHLSEDTRRETKTMLLTDLGVERLEQDLADTQALTNNGVSKTAVQMQDIDLGFKSELVKSLINDFPSLAVIKKEPKDDIVKNMAKVLFVEYEKANNEPLTKDIEAFANSFERWYLSKTPKGKFETEFGRWLYNKLGEFA